VAPWISLQLMELAKGRVVLALEGGYNLGSISNSFLACMQALLNDPYPEISGRRDLQQETLRTIKKVIQHTPLCAGTVMCIVLGLGYEL
jgi:acetoin utilization deacetylase AcuC-like enzyme